MATWFTNAAKTTKDLVLVTDDRDFEVLKNQGLSVIGTKELLGRLQNEPTASSALERQFRKFVQSQYFSALISFISGAAVAASRAR